MSRKYRFLAVAALLLPLIVAAVTAPALAGSTQTGTIKGEVVDQKGQPLPGVTIVLRSESMIRERATTTDADGVFFAPSLPNGRYRVTAQLQGFLSIEVVTDIQVDKITPLTITMKQGELTETVTVTSMRPVVVKTQTEGAKILEKKLTDNMPVPRNYQGLLQLAPGVTSTIGGGNPNMLGGTQNSNVYLTDGVSIRDPVTGTFGSNIVYDAFEEVDIKLTGISAEYGQTQGGLVNMVTKSGGNSFTGSLRDAISEPDWTLLYGQKSLDAYKPDKEAGTARGDTFAYVRKPIVQRSEEDAKRGQAIQTTLGGPIVTDRAWFFLAYQKVDTTFTKATVNPFGGPFGNGTYKGFNDSDQNLVKGTWQVTPSQRLSYLNNRTPANVVRNDPYCERFFGGCYDTADIEVQGQGDKTWIADWNAIWGPTIYTDVKYSRFQNGFTQDPLAPGKTFPGQPVGNQGGIGLGYEDSQGVIFDTHVFDPFPETRVRRQFEAQAVWFLDTKGLGTHTFKLGSDYYRQSRIGASIIHGNAYFYFTFVKPPPGMPGCDPANPETCGDAYSLSNRAYRQWIDMEPPSNAGPVNLMDVYYFQDDWQLNQNFSFNIGLRYEQNSNRNDINEKIYDKNQFAPRLGATWDVTGQGQHIIKSTWARYLAGINLTTLSPFARAAGGQSSYFVKNNINYPDAAAPIVWEIISEQRPSTTGASWAPNLKPQKIDEWTLGYEWGPTPDWGLGLKYIDRNWGNITTVRYSYDYSDGAARTQKIINNPDATRTYKAWVLSVDKRFSKNWAVSGSYTRSYAEGNVTDDSGFDTFESYTNVPQTTVNRYGKLPWDTPTMIKIQSFYRLPLKSERHNVTVGAIYDYRSGLPYTRNRLVSTIVGPGADGVQDCPIGTEADLTRSATREAYSMTAPYDLLPNYGCTAAQVRADQLDNVTGYYEPRGSNRSPALQEVDLSLRYQYAFNKKINLDVLFRVFNIFNAQKVTSYSGFSTTWYDINWGNPNLATWDSSTEQTRDRANYTFGTPGANAPQTGVFQTPRTYDLLIGITW